MFMIKYTFLFEVYKINNLNINSIYNLLNKLFSFFHFYIFPGVPLNELLKFFNASVITLNNTKFCPAAPFDKSLYIKFSKNVIFEFNFSG